MPFDFQVGLTARCDLWYHVQRWAQNKSTAVELESVSTSDVIYHFSEGSFCGVELWELIEKVPDDYYLERSLKVLGHDSL